MHIDDFLAQQMLKTNDPAPPYLLGATQPHRRELRTAWRRVRQVARRMGAFSSRRPPS